MTEVNEEAAIHAVLQAYVDAIRDHKPEKMLELFDRGATMSRIQPDGTLHITTDPGTSIGNYMRTIRPIPETCPNFTGRILTISRVGDMAMAWVQEDDLEGKDYNTFAHLHKVGGRWLITAKATRGVQRK